MTWESYRRVILKVSGESLGSEQPIDPLRIKETACAIANVRRLGVSTVVVVGGGNLFRQARGAEFGLESAKADEVGMLATGLNALLLAGALEAEQVPAHVISRGPCSGIGRRWQADDVRQLLDEGAVVVLAGGSGESGTSTDAPAVQCAIDVGADAVVMAKFGVEGVYDRDPRTDNARLLRIVTASMAISEQLAVMDRAALVLAREYRIPLHVIPARCVDGFAQVLAGVTLGSVIVPE